MSVNLTSIVSNALSLVFNLGSDIVKTVTYYRPPTFETRTGNVVTSEISASCSVILSQFSSRQILGFTVPARGRALIRNSELTTITGGPKVGDYFIDGDGRRRDVVAEPRKDTTGQLWTLDFEGSIHEDWGDLTTATSSEDRSDLTALTEAEDWGALF